MSKTSVFHPHPTIFPPLNGFSAPFTRGSADAWPHPLIFPPLNRFSGPVFTDVWPHQLIFPRSTVFRPFYAGQHRRMAASDYFSPAQLFFGPVFAWQHRRMAASA
jgi:hypothetical protein